MLSSSRHPCPLIAQECQILQPVQGGSHSGKKPTFFSQTLKLWGRAPETQVSPQGQGNKHPGRRASMVWRIIYTRPFLATKVQQLTHSRHIEAFQ